MPYNWKGQGYESLEALRTHLILFENDLVKKFAKEGTTGVKNADEALKLKPLDETPGADIVSLDISDTSDYAVMANSDGTIPDSSD